MARNWNDRTFRWRQVAAPLCAVFTLLTQICAAPSAVSANDEAAASVTSGAREPIRDKWALVIGISKFKDTSLNLKYPAKDALDFYNFLITDGRFAKDHVKLLLNESATRENILEQLGDKWLPRAAMPGDLVVIYLSTHGSPSEMDVGGVNYIVAHDTNPDSLYASGIAMQDLCRIVKARVHSDRTLIIMDACHSGATNPDGKGLVRRANVDAEAIAQGTGQMVICSSQPTETSWESKTAENSVFTKRLLEALKVRGGTTPMSDAFSYLKDKVQEDVLRERGQMQTPVLKSKWEGDDLQISAVPTAPRQPILPEAPATVPPKPQAVPKESPPPRAVPPVTQAAVPVKTAQPVKTQAAVPPTASADSAALAEKALRDHFVRMAYGTPKEAYDDFAANMKKITPFERYSVNVRKQHYVPAVSNMPAEAFKRVSATPDRAVILVNEKWITGLNLLWRYTMVKENGLWLIENSRMIQASEWR